MNDFKYNLTRLPGYNTPDKTLLSINGQAICVANGKDRCEEIIKFASTGDKSYCPNKKIRNRILEVLGGK